MLDLIKEKLKNYDRKRVTDSPLRKAAVLLPLFEKNGELHILFTKRTETVDVHKGQFSFPGGRSDGSDKSLRETALREVEEEIGIKEHDIEVIGALDDFETVTHYLVTPFAGIINGQRNYKINGFEIERILEVPFEFLMNDKNWKPEQYTHEGRVYAGEFCLYNNDKIWGITGRILRKFTKLINS